MSTFTNATIFKVSNLIYVNYLDILWLSGVCFCIWFLITSKSIRYKFCYFIFLILLTAVWGWWVDCDLFMIMMLLTEFLVVLLFLLIFFSYNFFSEGTVNNNKLFYIFYSTCFFIYLLAVPNAYGVKFSYYDFVYIFPLDIISSDLFFLYYFFFLIYPTITIFIIMLMGLFSVVFICLYFTVKKIQQIVFFEKTKVTILRKQNLTKQVLLKNQIQTFQK